MSPPAAVPGVSPLCTAAGLLSPVCAAASGAVSHAVGGAASSIAGFGVNAVFGGVADWVATGAGWLLGQIGSVLTTTTTVDIGSRWFGSHYRTMVALLGVVLLPMLLAATVQAVYRQSASMLLRAVLVQLPLAVVLAGAAVKVVQLALAATDALSAAVSAGSGSDIRDAVSGIGTQLAARAGAGVPAFVLLLGALLVAVGSLLLWVELLVRAAAVYVAVLFLPLALATLVWPAVAHWCRRLADTLAALILSKFVIVAVLSLATGAIASAGGGSGFASVLGGGALLLLAAFTPFTLLRLVPLIEAGAVHGLEGARHRVQQGVSSVPRATASLAARQLQGNPLAGLEPGTGLAPVYEAPGTAPGSRPGGGRAPGGRSGRDGGRRRPGGGGAGGGAAGGGAAGGGAGGDGTPRPGRSAHLAAPTTVEEGAPPGGIPVWQGDPDSPDPFEPHPTGVPKGPIPYKNLSMMDIIGLSRTGPPVKKDRGTHEIRHDAIGPVITWIPPGSTPGPTPGPDDQPPSTGPGDGS